jgi:hypothetical protein
MNSDVIKVKERISTEQESGKSNITFLWRVVGQVKSREALAICQDAMPQSVKRIGPRRPIGRAVSSRHHNASRPRHRFAMGERPEIAEAHHAKIAGLCRVLFPFFNAAHS